MLKLFLTTITFLLSQFVFSLNLTPSSYELSPTGSLSSHVFEIENDANELIAIQVSIATREWSEEQKEINVNTSDFDIFPPQLILKPKEKKGVRVRWKGEKKFKNEKSFRLIVRQLPVNFKKDKNDSGMKALHNVIGALYVTPKGVKENIEISNVSKKTMIVTEDEKDEEQKSADFLVFDVKNNGSKHILLNKLELVAKNKKDSVNITPKMLSTLATQNVLPGALLTVRLAWPKSLGENVSSVEIK